MKRKVGFIGLGVMGGHMARQLSHVENLVVYDVDPSKRDLIENAVASPSIMDLGNETEVVLLSLPTSEIVKEVILGDNGLIHAMKSGGLIIDASTTAPAISKSIAIELAKKDIEFIDSPVSGGESAARSGELAIMVGANEQAFARAFPILEIIGKSVVHVGGIGAGGVVKLVNNMIVGATFSVIAEGFALGKFNGIDADVLFEAIRGGWAGSKVLEVAGPDMIDQDFTPGGTINLLYKDLGYALSLANEQNVPVPMTAVSNEVFKVARASGRGAFSQSIIIEMWEELLGLRP